jgi:hypothetical protein
MSLKGRGAEWRQGGRRKGERLFWGAELGRRVCSVQEDFQKEWRKELEKKFSKTFGVFDKLFFVGWLLQV